MKGTTVPFFSPAFVITSTYFVLHCCQMQILLSSDSLDYRTTPFLPPVASGGSFLLASSASVNLTTCLYDCTERHVLHLISPSFFCSIIEGRVSTRKPGATHIRPLKSLLCLLKAADLQPSAG